MPEAISFQNLVGDARALDLVKQRYLVAQKAQAKTHKDYDTWFRIYNSELVRPNYQGFSEVVVPKGFEKVERGTALLFQAIKRVKVFGQGDEDKENAKVNEKLIEFEERVLGWKRIIKQWIKSARIHGEAYIKVTWDLSSEKDQMPYKGLEISLPDPKSIFFNPDYTPDQQFRWIIHEMNVPYSSLLNRGFDKGALEKVKATSGQKPVRSLTEGGVIKTYDSSDTTTLNVNIKEYFGPYSDKGEDEEEDYIITTANNVVVLKKVKSPYAEILERPIPIFPLQIYVTPHTAHSKGDPEAIESQYRELNDIRNQRMDTVTLNIDPMKIILRAAQIDEKDLIAKRGWVVHSNIPGGVTVVSPDMQGVRAAIDEEKIIQGDIDRTIGIPSFGAQTPVAGDITTDTATGVNATLQAQDIISNSILDELKTSLQLFYRTILAYNQKFIDKKFKVQLLGEKGGESFEVSKAKIKGNFDLDVEVELVGNRIARRAEALAALQIGSKIQGSNIAKLYEDYLATHDKYDFEQYYKAPTPPPPESPRVAISLKGELNEIQSAQVYGTIPGVNQTFKDPAWTKEGRQILKGRLPEEIEQEEKRAEIMKNRATAENQLQNAQIPISRRE